MKFVSVIPARGGSKGLKKKNLALLNNKPLIEYTIEAAIKSNNINKIIISSENDEILDITSKYTSKNVWNIKRPLKLAGDTISIIDVLIHLFETIDYLKNHQIDVVVLQPTSPLRTKKDIDNAINIYKKGNCESLISVTEADHPPQWNLMIQNGNLKPFMDKKYLNLRRQELIKTYRPNGAIFIANKHTISTNRSFYTEPMMPYIMPNERSIDIDDEFDLKLAECILRMGNE